MNKAIKEKIIILVCATISFSYVSADFVNNKLVIYPLSGSSMMNTCSILGFVVLYSMLWKYWPQKNNKVFYALASLVSAVFSFISIMGNYFVSEPTKGIAQIFTNSLTDMCKAGIVFLGGCCFYFALIIGIGALKCWYERNQSVDIFGYKVNSFLYGKYSFIKHLMIMAICWFPHFLIRYPGAMVKDIWDCLNQYVGNVSYTTQHPIVYTLLFGKLYDLGGMLGNRNYGLFILVLIQAILTLLVLAYTIQTMRRFNVPKWLITVTLGVFCVFPVIIATVTTAMIDAIFCAAMLLFVNELAYYLFEPEEYKKSVRHLSLTIAAVIFSFVRYNGVYIVLPTLMVMILWEGYLLFKKKQQFRYTLVIVLAILVPLICGKTGTSALNEKYDSQVISSRVLFVVPMQQVARCMVYHEDYFDEEVMTNIQKVMTGDVEYYQERYFVYSFDTIKYSFNYEATMQDKLDFLKAWIKVVLKYPGTCLSATINQTFFLFSPTIDNQKYYKDAVSYEKIGNYNFTGTFHVNEKWNGLRRQLVLYYYKFGQMPVLGILVNQGFHSIILFAVCLYAICRKNAKLFIFNVPMLLTCAIAFLGPDMQGHPRYTYPMMYVFPLMLGLFIANKGFEDSIKISIKDITEKE